ncbi:MAG: type II toxin-antitoxin system RelE/ParE family toxin [Desulfobacula sp.]|nr:type II toxin-antitoxin system RelE/ParE family toxin [Desulfobacula sp.]
MIKSFKCKETKKIFNRIYSTKWSKNIQTVAFRKLRMLKNSKNLTDLKISPSNRLEKLKGNRKDQYSIRINDQWRVCLIWQHPDAYHVEIVDYH